MVICVKRVFYCFSRGFEQFPQFIKPRINRPFFTKKNQWTLNPKEKNLNTYFPPIPAIRMIATNNPRFHIVFFIKKAEQVTGRLRPCPALR